MRVYSGKHSTCKECGHTRVERNAVFSCDGCGKVLDTDRFTYLHSTLYLEQGNPEIPLDFCSWHCFISYILTLENEYGESIDFLAMPFIHREGQPGCTLGDLIKELRSGYIEKQD